MTEVSLELVGTVWMARTAATIYGRSILRTGSRVGLRHVLARGGAAWAALRRSRLGCTAAEPPD